MKKIVRKGLLALGLTFISFFPLAAFETGPLLYLRADFGGALTTPFISDKSLKRFNSGALKMTGMMSSLLMGGEIEGGYVFGSDTLFGLRKNHPLSALGTFAFLGFGQGNSGQKITADTPSGILDTFVFINFMPVVNFGVSAKAYFFHNKLALGASLGGRIITDFSPDYLVYSTDPNIIKTEVGQIIVTEDMMKKMNPFMFSAATVIEYGISLMETTDIVFGWYTKFNLYQPKYLTAPPSLAKLARDNGGDISQPFPDYWLNSLDFGVKLGFAFKL